MGGGGPKLYIQTDTHTHAHAHTMCTQRAHNVHTMHTQHPTAHHSTPHHTERGVNMIDVEEQMDGRLFKTVPFSGGFEDKRSRLLEKKFITLNDKVIVLKIDVTGSLL